MAQPNVKKILNVIICPGHMSATVSPVIMLCKMSVTILTNVMQCGLTNAINQTAFASIRLAVIHVIVKMDSKKLVISAMTLMRTVFKITSCESV